MVALSRVHTNARHRDLEPGKQEKVPSDLVSSFALRRHARHRALQSGRGAFRLSAPQRAFSPPAGSMPPGTPPAVPDRDRSLVTAFRSPATAALSLSLHPEVNAPGLLLRFLPARPRHPFGPTLHDRARFAPATAASSLGPRYSGCAQYGNCSTGMPPPRDFYLPRDRKQYRLGRYPARLPKPPDSLSLPGVASVTSFSTGSSFPGRYVSVGLLFLKPLGTSLTMLSKRVCVKLFPLVLGGFQQHLP